MPDLPDWLNMVPKKRDDLLKKLAQQGLSTSKIAGHFQNASRNAVIGRLHRIEARDGPLKRNGSTSSKRKLSAAQVKKPAGKKTDGRTEAAMVNRIQVKTETPPDRVLPAEKRGSFDPLPGVKPLPIIELPVRLRCRWPIDVPETKTHFACGAATLSDTHVYCAPHRRLSVGA